MLGTIGEQFEQAEFSQIQPELEEQNDNEVLRVSEMSDKYLQKLCKITQM